MGDHESALRSRELVICHRTSLCLDEHNQPTTAGPPHVLPRYILAPYQTTFSHAARGGWCAVGAGSTIVKPQWSPAPCLARVGRSRRASQGLAGDPLRLLPPEGISMALYMYQASYTAKSMAAQLKEPQDPVEAIRPALEDVGAKILVAGFPFGEYDVLVVYEAPDDMTAASVAMAVAAAGEVKSAKTTRLLSGQEWLESLRKRRIVTIRKARQPDDHRRESPEHLSTTSRSADAFGQAYLTVPALNPPGPSAPAVTVKGRVGRPATGARVREIVML